MITVPLIPENAPFNAEQRAWLNGFLAGVFSRAPLPSYAPPSAPSAPALRPLTILFGSQTGTAEGLAKRASKEAGRRGFAATVVDMAQTSAAQLAQCSAALLITSTYGDGAPPDNAKALHAELASDSAPSLAPLHFSVCAIGDSNYAQFCRCGRDFDSLLEKRGATRSAPLVECDVDQDAAFKSWLDHALASFGPGTAPVSSPSPRPVEEPKAAPSGFSKANPYPSILLSRSRLSGPESAKEINHLVFKIPDSGLTYEAGDALGVMPRNCPLVVDELLAALGWDGEEDVPAPDGSHLPLKLALLSHYDLGKPTPDLLAAFEPSGNGGTAIALRHVIDVVASRSRFSLSPAGFVGLLKRIQPRLYSISSSPKAHPGEVHLTVGTVRYEADGRRRLGVCSTFLAERTIPGESTVPIHVHSNKAFRLPLDPKAPMIMIGPGTGIAPFRAFIEERIATGSTGPNWLFFGDQRASCDFIYRDEIATWQSRGALARLSTAFSRDQASKVYVQHRMLEQAAELYRWLDDGAHVYVCGDATRMAADVDTALREVLARAGGLSPEQAAARVQSLSKDKRYCRDVY